MLELRRPNRLLAEVRSWATDRGMDLCGGIGSEDFDGSQPAGRRAHEILPECDTILLLGTGGRRGWDAVLRDLGGRLDPPRPGYDPIDGWSRRLATELLERLGLQGYRGQVVMPGDRRSLNLRQLGEMVGLGTVSPVIGHLLHPEFGPWVSLRAVLLLTGLPFGRLSATQMSGFQPCASCHRPCVSACPVQTFDGLGEIRIERCVDHRTSGACGDGCDVLGACPVGRDHRYGHEEEHFRQASATFTMASARKPSWLRALPGLRRRRT